MPSTLLWDLTVSLQACQPLRRTGKPSEQEPHPDCSWQFGYGQAELSETEQDCPSPGLWAPDGPQSNKLGEHKVKQRESRVLTAGLLGSLKWGWGSKNKVCSASHSNLKTEPSF